MSKPKFSPDGEGVEAMVQDLLTTLGSVVSLGPNETEHIRNALRLAHAKGRLREFEEGRRCLLAGRAWAWKGQRVPESPWVDRRQRHEEDGDALH